MMGGFDMGGMGEHLPQVASPGGGGSFGALRPSSRPGSYEGPGVGVQRALSPDQRDRGQITEEIAIISGRRFLIAVFVLVSRERKRKRERERASGAANE
jgi:hypothetical protein